MSHPPARIDLDNILPVVYDELRQFASRALRQERDGHSFQTTELVHEAYVRLARLEAIKWDDQDHVLRAAVGVMRRVLIDHARAHNAQKRSPGQLFLRCPDRGFDEVIEDGPQLDLIALDEALEKLREFDTRKAEVVELRYFGGQPIETIARLLETSPATVKRDWTLAKAWLFRELNPESIQG